MELTTKSACVCICQNSMCLWIVALRTGGVSFGLFNNRFSVAAHRLRAVLLPPPFPPSFHCFNSVKDVCSSYCLGAHGWVARICQPWEQPSFRSWLPIVEAILPRYNTVKYGRYSIRYLGPLLWSKLASSERNAPTLKDFKQRINCRDISAFDNSGCASCFLCNT